MLQLTAGSEPTMASNHRQPYAEDYFSDDGQNKNNNGVPIGAFTPDASPGKANVRTKRSNPEDLGTEKTPTGRVPTFDVKSDSGATSQRSPPVVNTVPAAPSPTPAQRAPRPPPSRQQSTQSAQSSQSASRHPLSRRDSQASRRPPTTERRPTITREPAPKRRDSRNVDECTVPGCTGCGPDAIETRPRQSRRQSMLQTQPAESAPDVSYPHPYDTRSQVSDPTQYQASSPREAQQPRTYHTPQGGPVIQPGISRRLSVNSRQARPTSYHGDPNFNWQQPGMHSSHPNLSHEHGPPLSRSAYGNLPYTQPQMNAPYIQQYQPQGPSPAAFYQAQQMQPTHNQQRPPLQARVSQTSAYGYPIPPPVVHVERSDRNMPSARYHSNAPHQLPAQRRQPRIEYPDQEDYDSQSESESETESEEDYEPEYQPQSRLQKGAPQRRPSLRHAKTTPAPPAPEPRRPQTVVIPERRVSRRDRNLDPRPTRRTSMSRPPLVPSIKSESTYDTPRARVIVENPQSSRRESLQAYDKTFKEHRRARQQEYEQKLPKRSSRAYDNVVLGHDYERDYHDDDEEAALVTRAPLRRRDTDTEPRRRPQRSVEVRQAADAEDYINARRGERDTYADQTYEIAKRRSSRASGGPSEAESSRSKGSDNNGEIRLRIGNDAPVTLSLNGDMEGRTLQLVPIENGMNELVISSNSRSGESTYRSERGSTRGDRKTITSASQARRDAEEMTERSSQSNRRRRETRGEQDEPRRVLHRQTRRGERKGPEYQY
ncbi:hypothetical protein BU25DRAFT_190768 [Macroventuria anomochaeta]|uniref:Uncharacterized protein n=1 Tax=Macroventuria anomochaeta TaxID=301207 RepID=A0ACB6SC42_9PLEO|nr:uncharacterized protein BU25DRAFT_190768 [Macroventuria anomochaeta]KAF2631543.1 hypothetical protein BU25DRAFT_190768 [Macroventuria anomochaeta]